MVTMQCKKSSFALKRATITTLKFGDRRGMNMHIISEEPEIQKELRNDLATGTATTYMQTSLIQCCTNHKFKTVKCNLLPYVKQLIRSISNPALPSGFLYGIKTLVRSPDYPLYYLQKNDATLIESICIQTPENKLANNMYIWSQTEHKVLYIIDIYGEI